MAYERYYYKKLAPLGRFPGVGHVLHLISASGKSTLIFTSGWSRLWPHCDQFIMNPLLSACCLFVVSLASAILTA